MHLIHILRGRGGSRWVDKPAAIRRIHRRYRLLRIKLLLRWDIHRRYRLLRIKLLLRWDIHRRYRLLRIKLLLRWDIHRHHCLGSVCRRRYLRLLGRQIAHVWEALFVFLPPEVFAGFVEYYGCVDEGSDEEEPMYDVS
jgi:hypothetical protein